MTGFDVYKKAFSFRFKKLTADMIRADWEKLTLTDKEMFMKEAKKTNGNITSPDEQPL